MSFIGYVGSSAPHSFVRSTRGEIRVFQAENIRVSVVKCGGRVV